MITAAFPVSVAAEQANQSRTISGVAVPWNADGIVGDGTHVRFLPGSLDANARPVALRDHDRSRPIGRVSDAFETDAGMGVRTRIAATAAGDETLTLAADGVLMFSVGVNPTSFHHDGDTLVVEAADWQEISLLPLGAFSDAVVTHVAATAPTQEGPPMPETLTPEVNAAPPVEVAATAPIAPAQPPERPQTVPIVQAPTGRAPLTLSGLAQVWAASSRGEISTDAARATIAAALADVTTTNIAGVVQPSYRTELVGLINQGRPLIDAIANAPLPASGMTVEYPKWTAPPEVALQAAEKTAVHSAPVTMGLGSAPVLTWAGANDVSLQAVERSSPSFLERYLAAAAVDFARKTDAYVATTLLAAAGAVTAGADFVANIAALIGAMDPAQTPGGGLFVAVAQDVGVGLIGITQQNGPAFWQGSVRFGSMPITATAGGLDIFVDTNLPAGTYLAGSKQGATWFQSPGAPADIRVVDVSLLGLDIGVYGFGALTVEWPGSFKKISPVGP